MASSRDLPMTPEQELAFFGPEIYYANRAPKKRPETKEQPRASTNGDNRGTGHSATLLRDEYSRAKRDPTSGSPGALVPTSLVSEPTSSVAAGGASPGLVSETVFNRDYAVWLTRSVISEERYIDRPANISWYRSFNSLSGYKGASVSTPTPGVVEVAFTTGPTVCMQEVTLNDQQIRRVAC